MLLFTAEGSCRLFIRSGSHLHPTKPFSSRIGRNLSACTQRQQQGTKTREAREKRREKIEEHRERMEEGEGRERNRYRGLPAMGVTSLTVSAQLVLSDSSQPQAGSLITEPHGKQS